MYKINYPEESKIVLENPLGEMLFSSEKCQLIRLTLKKDESLSKHKNPVDVVFYILDGNGEIEINSEKAILKAGCSVYVSKEEDRSWRNLSEKELRILVYKIL